MTEEEKDAAAAMVKLHENVAELVNKVINDAFAEAGLDSAAGYTHPNYTYALCNKFHEIEDKIQRLQNQINALGVGGR